MTKLVSIFTSVSRNYSVFQQKIWAEDIVKTKLNEAISFNFWVEFATIFDTEQTQRIGELIINATKRVINANDDNNTVENNEFEKANIISFLLILNSPIMANAVKTKDFLQQIPSLVDYWLMSS